MDQVNDVEQYGSLVLRNADHGEIWVTDSTRPSGQIDVHDLHGMKPRETDYWVQVVDEIDAEDAKLTDLMVGDLLAWREGWVGVKVYRRPR